MFKRSIISLCFLAYSLTLVHSFVPHHHHDKSISNDQYDLNHDHHNQDENRTVGHAFADAIHLPGSDVALHGPSPDSFQRQFFVSEISVDALTFSLAHQLKSPDLNYDYRHTCYSPANNSLFLLRAPPVA